MSLPSKRYCDFSFADLAIDYYKYCLERNEDCIFILLEPEIILADIILEGRIIDAYEDGMD